MRIKGIKLKGINIRESKGTKIPLAIQVCKHKYNANATWSHGTDLYKPNLAGHGIDGEINAFKYNLQLTVWENFYYGGSIQKDILDLYKTGRVGLGVYYMTLYWKDPITGEIVPIPDYGNTKWTQLSCDKGLIPQNMVGQSKVQNYPAIDNLFELTSGKYGFNVDTGEIGKIDIITDVIKAHYNWFVSAFNKKPSILGYGSGFDKLKVIFKDIFLGCRNSVWRVDNYDYDMSKEVLSSYPLTTRQNDMTGDRPSKHKLCQDYLKNAISQKGWFRDFSHWHWCKDTELEDFYRTQREVMDNVVTLGFDEAIEYMVLRQSCTSVNAYTKDNKIYIEGTFNSKSDIIKTTLSVKVNLAGTVLEGKNIKTTYGAIKLSANEYIIQLPSWGFTVLEESVNGQYLDFELPKIVEYSISNNELKVVTDKDTNIVLFKVTKGLNLYNSEVVKRSNRMTKIHYIDLSKENLSLIDLYIGAITKERQSILSNKL